MKKEPNKKAIGLFIVVGFALFLGLIGQSVWQKINTDNEDIYVMYFHETLQGLSEGAPIVFQGVEIGKVTRIRLVADSDDLKFHLPVYAHLNPIVDVAEDSIWERLWQRDGDLLHPLIEQGLRARLVTQSYLTGQLMIELVMLPDSEIEMQNEQGQKYPQIPTVLSETEEFAKGLNKLQLGEIVTQLKDITGLLQKELPVLLPEITQSAKNLNIILGKMANNSGEIVTNLNTTLAKVAGSSDETIANMNKTLQDLSDTAKSLQNLTDYLERHPEALIKGKKGE